jgi:hypothetical protein
MFGGKIGLPELIILLGTVVVIIWTGRVGRYGFGGFLLGAFVGFLLRPSVPMLGQLPFEVVITRGANLTGANVLMRSAAERSFNYTLVGAIIGAVVLAITAGLTMNRKDGSGNALAKASVSATPVAASVAPVKAASRFCTKCGESVLADSDFCGGCGAKIAQPSPPV